MRAGDALQRHNFRLLSIERTVGYIGLFCLALIVAAIVAVAAQERAQLRGQAEEATRTAAFFLSDHASRLFEVSDFVIKETATAIEGQSWREIEASKGLWDRLKLLNDRLPYLEGIWLNDALGELRLSTVQFPRPRSNVADRDFFRAHQGPNVGLHLSELITGRVTGKQSLLLSRRLSAPDGELRGMASVTVGVAYFAEFFSQLKLPFDPVVILYRGPEMTLVAGHAAAGQPAPRPGAKALAAAAASAPVVGTLPRAIAEDGSAAILSYHRVGDLPLYTTVLIPNARLDQVWWKQVRVYAVLGGAAILAMIALILFAFRQARRVAAVHADLEQRVEARTADLAAANAELATLFQEVHHRVKNNLQVVTSLLRLQQGRFEDPILRSALQDSIDRIHAMGLVHQMLYGAQALSAVDFGAYAAALTRELVAAYGMSERVEIAVESADVHFDLNTTIPLALIVNELVSNALKHGFPDGKHGRIAIVVATEGGHYLVTLSDNGTGLPDGFDWTQAQGLGLKIVRSLAAQLAGVAAFERDGGSRFTLRFPYRPDGTA